MSGFPILDLVVGMIFIYFLLSIICSSVVEIMLTVAKARAKLLEEWLVGIFDEKTKVGSEIKTVGESILDHCAVTALSGKGKSPSYIDAKNFTSALLEKITFDPNNPNSIATDLDTFIHKIEQTPFLSLELKRVFLNYAYEARDRYQTMITKTVSDLEIFRSKIENWYDTSMDRVTGSLKTKYSRPFTMIVAIVTAILLNADSINIAKYLYSDPDLRAKVAEQAYSAVDSSAQKFTARLDSMRSANPQTVQELEATLQQGINNISDAKATLQLNLPFGWNTAYFKTLFPPGNFWEGILGILAKITGLAATVFAMMMGAPFWFDLLNKVSNLRGTGNKPASSSGAAGDTPTPTQAPAPITISVNTNKEEEAVG
ncbi:MAG TPA: hypothetical protein VFW07_00665 [Parafilimonas sp.]|nr:hypothetical protein [Parafilimonas sp.]